MATLTQCTGALDDLENFGTSGGRASGFKIPSDATCTGVSIYGSQSATSSGTIAISIYSGANPGSTLVYTETFTTTAVLHAYDGTPYWNDITFASSFALTAGTQYYIRCIALTGVLNDELKWGRTTNASSGYTDGAMWGYSSPTWTQYTTLDEQFKIYGFTGSSTTPISTLAFMGAG